MSDESPPNLLPGPAAAAPVAPKGIFQREARSFFKTAATAKRKAALQQQKEQQLATDRAKVLQAKVERTEPADYSLIPGGGCVAGRSRRV